MPGRLRPRAGAAGQLRVLRQPDRRDAPWSSSTRCAAASGRCPTRGAPLTDFRTVELELGRDLRRPATASGWPTRVAGATRRADRRDRLPRARQRRRASTRLGERPAMPDAAAAPCRHLPEKAGGRLRATQHAGTTLTPGRRSDPGRSTEPALARARRVAWPTLATVYDAQLTDGLTTRGSPAPRLPRGRGPARSLASRAGQGLRPARPRRRRLPDRA